jgi:ribonucleoside-diphosphate reductase alpha chain
VASELGLDPERHTVTPALERGSGAFCRGFLRGLFDVHGGVQGNPRDGVGVRLEHGDDRLLEAAQRILLRLGIASRIVRDARPAETRALPDGRGGERLYPAKGRHELVISGDNLAVFADRIGFADETKAVRLDVLMASYPRALKPEPFTATVAGVEAAGAEPVYDVEIPGINAFDANGLVVHNCGEQPLPPYGTCLLGSINLARLVLDPFEANAQLDMDALDGVVGAAVRMMDNVIDTSRYPLPRQEREAKSKRRIGLGITGLADALIQCGARYGGHEAVTLTETWMRAIQRAA